MSAAEHHGKNGSPPQSERRRRRAPTYPRPPAAASARHSQGPAAELPPRSPELHRKYLHKKRCRVERHGREVYSKKQVALVLNIRRHRHVHDCKSRFVHLRPRMPNVCLWSISPIAARTFFRIAIAFSSGQSFSTFRITTTSSADAATGMLPARKAES